MKKKIPAAVLFFFITLASAFCKEKIFHAETEFFDIIFEEEAKNSAMEISACADEVLKNLCLEYKVEPDFKIPVVITSKTENLNAYFTNYNYNHIVIYDTTPAESLLNFKDTIKSIFIHELTHLVSTNAKNGFWKAAGKICGDIYNPGYYLTMTTFFKEGASVAEESKNNEGRLNDGFFLHDLKQAKISGKFPGCTDTFGARTIYPYGSASYLFGSAFTEFIISKYGMDKYAEFWHNGINSKRLTPYAVFKKTYGISMKKEWKNFYASIDVSAVENIESSGKIKKSGFKNRPLHLYSLAGTVKNKNIIFDETSSSVYEDNKKLWTKTGLISARVCCGKYIVTTSSDSNHLDTKTKAEIFNTENKKWRSINESGIKELCIFKSEGKEFLACIKTVSQKCIFQVRNMDRDFSVVQSFEFSRNKIPYSLCCSGESLWFLLKDKMNYSLCRADFSGGKISVSTFELKNIMPRQLSACKTSDGKTTVLFSYAEGKSFPRLAFGEISGNKLSLKLLEKDLSGGIYSPVLNGENIFYAARFWTEGAVYKLDYKNLNEGLSLLAVTAEESQVFNFNGSDAEEKKSADETAATDNFTFSEYKKILYPGKTIVPLSVLNSYYLSPSVYYSAEEDCLGQGSSYVLGFTVIKNNPWDTKHIALTAGFSPSKKAGGTGIILMGKSSSGNFSIEDTANSIFGKTGFEQFNNNFTSSVQFKTGNISKIIFSETNFFLYGKNDMNASAKEKYSLTDEQLNKNYIYDKNTVSIQFSTLHKTGAKTYENCGIKTGFNLKNVFVTARAEKEASVFYRMIHYENDCLKFSQVYPNAQLSLPGILPYGCKGSFTYNLPLILYGSLFEFNDTFITWNAKAVLFSWEVQKGFGAVPLFANTLTLNALYQEEFLTGLNRSMEIQYLKDDFKNLNSMGKNKYAGASLVLILSGNTGVLASQGINFSLGGKVLRCLEGNHKGETNFLLTALLNFSLF